MDFATVDRKERTVYVTGIHPGCTEGQLYDLFNKTGVVEKVVLHLTEEGNPHYCLVVYKDPESVMFTIAQLNGHRLLGQAMNLRPLRESSHAAVLQRAITRRRGPVPPHFAPLHQPHFPNHSAPRTPTSPPWNHHHDSAFHDLDHSPRMHFPAYSAPFHNSAPFANSGSYNGSGNFGGSGSFGGSGTYGHF